MNALCVRESIFVLALGNSELIFSFCPVVFFSDFKIRVQYYIRRRKLKKKSAVHAFWEEIFSFSLQSNYKYDFDITQEKKAGFGLSCQRKQR